MATKTLIIKITGDNTDHKRAIAESIAAQGKLDKEAKKTADNQVKEAKRAFDASFVGIGKVQMAAVKHSDKMIAEAKKLADAQIKADQKAFDAKFVSFSSLQAAGVKFTAMQIAEEKKLADAQTRMTKQRLSDEQVALLARNGLIQKANQKRIDAATKVMDADKKGFSVSAFAAGQFKDVLTGVAGQFAAINLLQSGFAALTGMWDQWKTDSLEAAKNIGNVREQLLELAALKGHLGDTTTENMEQLTFRSKTLQSAEQSKAFQGQFLNTSQSSVDAGLMTAQGAKDWMVESGKFQAAEGGDAGVHATLAGSLPSMLGKKADGTAWTPAELKEHQQRLYNQQQRGSFTFSQGASQLTDLQGVLGTGAFGKGPEALHQLAGMHTAISNQVSPGQAGTVTEQVVDALTGSQRRMKGPKVDQQDGDQKMAEYYKSIGAGADMNLTAPQLMGKVMADLDKQEKAGGAMTDDNLWHYMQGKGFMNRQAITGMGAMFKAHKTGQLSAHMDRAVAPGGMMPADLADPNYVPYDESMQRFNAGPVAGGRRASLAKDLEQTSTGLKTEGYRHLQEMAFRSLKAQGLAYGGSFEDYAKDSTTGGAQALDAEIERMTLKAAKDKGIAVNKVASQTFGSAGGSSTVAGYSSVDGVKISGLSGPMDYGLTDEAGAKRAEKYQNASDVLSSKGASVEQAFLAELVRLAKEQSEKAKASERRRTPPVLPAVPAPAMRRP